MEELARKRRVEINELYTGEDGQGDGDRRFVQGDEQPSLLKLPDVSGVGGQRWADCGRA